MRVRSRLKWVMAFAVLGYVATAGAQTPPPASGGGAGAGGASGQTTGQTTGQVGFQRCKKDVFVMHPGPMNRGIEIQSDIADGPQSGILQQVTNGLAVRMAVLYLVTQVGSGG